MRSGATPTTAVSDRQVLMVTMVEDPEQVVFEHVDQPDRRDRLAIPLLVLGNGISLTGNSLTALVIPWFVYVTTGSAARTGLVALASFLPVVLAGMAGGLVVDRVGFKRASVVSDVLSGVTVAIIPTLHLAGLLQFWHLFVLVFAGALLDIPGSAARQSMIPRLAARAKTSLETANAGMQMASAVAMIVGPLAAGLLMSILGATTVLYLDAGSFAISALMIGALVPWRRSAEEAAQDEPAREGMMREALAGARLIVHDRFLSAVVRLSVVANFLFSALFAVALPVYAKQIFDDARVLGVMIAGFGAGSLVGTIVFGVVGPRVSRVKLLLGGIVLMAAGLWVLPWSSSVAVSVVGAVIIGLANGPVNATMMVILQERVPERLLGRVNSSLMAMVTIASPVGVVIAGFVLDSIAVSLVMAGIAAIFSLVALSALLNPEIRSAPDRLSVTDR